MDRELLESAFKEYRKSIGRSEDLDNPAKSLIRNMGLEDDLGSSLFKSLYTLGTIDKIEKSKVHDKQINNK